MFRSMNLLLLMCIMLNGCIGDDLILDTVPEMLRIINPLETLAVGDTYTFELLFTNNVGIEETRGASWASSDPLILTIDQTGTAQGLSKGRATVSAQVQISNDADLIIELDITVDEETVASDDHTRRGVIQTTSFYVLEGDFTVTRSGEKLIIDIDENYKASSALPGLYLYLTNNPNTTQGALEVGAVEVFEGAHSYSLEGNIPLNQYDYLLYFCKPFNVKVGDGKIEE